MKTKRYQILVAVLACGIWTANAAETWLTGMPFVANRMLFFRLDAPVEGNNRGAVVKLGVAKNATSLFPALEGAAQKGIAVRLYGRIDRDNTAPPDYRGAPLPNVSFIVWKAHLPNEADTWDPGTKPQNLQKDNVLTDNRTGEIVASQPVGTGYGTAAHPIYEVPKNSKLRKEIVLGILDQMYKDRATSIQNPRRFTPTFSHFLCNGTMAAVKVTKLTGLGRMTDPSPVLIFLKQDDRGVWYVTEQVKYTNAKQRADWVALGLPASMIP